MPQYGQTKRQHELLMYIDKYIAAHGYSPSYDEMKDALGLASKSGIHRLVNGLKSRNLINYIPDYARSITINQDAVYEAGIVL